MSYLRSSNSRKTTFKYKEVKLFMEEGIVDSFRKERQMLTLGIAHTTSTIDKKMLQLFSRPAYTTAIITKEDDLSQLSGLLIPIQSKQQLTTTFDWLVSIKTEATLFKWVYSEIPIEEEALVFFKLGVQSILSAMQRKEELSLCVENTLTLLKEITTSKPSNQKSTNMFLNREKQCVFIDGEEHPLTQKEFLLLDYLYEKKGSIVTYEELYMLGWGETDEVDQKKCRYTIANTIHRLRGKIMLGTPYEIISVTGVGYRLIE